MQIEANTSVAFIGPSGCGKSTFLRLFNRMNDLIPDTHMDGKILIDGRDIYGKGEKVDLLRKNVGMVFQKPNPFPKTIFENVAYGLRVNGIKDNAYIEETVVKTLKQVVLWDEVKDKLKESAFALSGGQQQRLCIARALLKKPKILILDDSTSAVDTKTDALIRKAFLEEIPDTTKIIIAQRVSSVQDADHIIVMDDGKISAYGTHKELLKSSDIYREVYESQVKGGSDDEQ